MPFSCWWTGQTLGFVFLLFRLDGAGFFVVDDGLSTVPVGVVTLRIWVDARTGREALDDADAGDFTSVVLPGVLAADELGLLRPRRPEMRGLARNSSRTAISSSTFWRVVMTSCSMRSRRVLLSARLILCLRRSDSRFRWSCSVVRTLFGRWPSSSPAALILSFDGCVETVQSHPQQ